jgi:hypothetical protein
MKFGKRGKGEKSADEPAATSARNVPPATVSWPGPEPDPPEPAIPEATVVGEAVELDAGPLPPATPVARPVPPPSPGAASGSTHGPGATPLSSTAAAGAPVADGHGPDPLTDPLRELAAERPEVVVGAAFAGGILAAMILRRLGN